MALFKRAVVNTKLFQIRGAAELKAWLANTVLSAGWESYLCAIYAGCWDNPDNRECLPEPGCVARSPLNHPNIRNNTRFCCCRGNLCNVNVTDNVNFTALEIISRQQSALDAAQHVG